MDKKEISSLIITTECLLCKYTKLLDENPLELKGELRIKLGLAELNLFKIIELLKKQQ